MMGQQSLKESKIEITEIFGPMFGPMYQHGHATSSGGLDAGVLYVLSRLKKRKKTRKKPMEYLVRLLKTIDLLPLLDQLQ